MRHRHARPAANSGRSTMRSWKRIRSRPTDQHSHDNAQWFVARRAQESGHAAPAVSRRLVDANGRFFRTGLGVVLDDGVEAAKRERPVGQESGEIRWKKRWFAPAVDAVRERRSEDGQPRRIELDARRMAWSGLFDGDRHDRGAQTGEGEISRARKEKGAKRMRA